jgi:hypothetical protein
MIRDPLYSQRDSGECTAFSQVLIQPGVTRWLRPGLGQSNSLARAVLRFQFRGSSRAGRCEVREFSGDQYDSSQNENWVQHCHLLRALRTVDAAGRTSRNELSISQDDSSSLFRLARLKGMTNGVKMAKVWKSVRKRKIEWKHD